MYYRLHLCFCFRALCLWRLCVHAAAVLSASSQAIFQLLVVFSVRLPSVPLLKMPAQQRGPPAPPWTASSLLLTLVNPDLLAGVSATIRASAVAEVMLLKGFACLLEVGWGAHRDVTRANLG